MDEDFTRSEVRGAEVQIPVTGARVGGILAVPDGADGIVLFAHGAGSSRFSPRNQYVAGVLLDAGLGTLLFDLLTEAESADRANVFDIELLTARVIGATRWVHEREETANLRVGYFGASTGAAAALVAAAELGPEVGAVVSRGGRPDMAGAEHLRRVLAPTLLIVGGRDEPVIGMNRQAYDELRVEKRLEIVPGATHLFEEPGALERVASLARDWCLEHLVPEK